MWLYQNKSCGNKIPLIHRPICQTVIDKTRNRSPIYIVQYTGALVIIFGACVLGEHYFALILESLLKITADDVTYSSHCPANLSVHIK